MPQEFTTAAELRLEVLNDPSTPPGGYPRFRNYVRNDGYFAAGVPYGGWGWLSPVEATLVDAGTDGESLQLQTTVAQSGVYFTTEPIPAKPGATHIRYGLSRPSGLSTTTTIGVRGRVDFYDADGVLLGSSASTATLVEGSAPAGGYPGNQAIPAGTVTMKLRVDVTKAGGPALAALDRAHIRGVELVQGTLAELNADPAGTQLEDGWVDILGPTAELTIERTELNLGTLTATIYSPALDPADADTIRKGKAIRLLLGPTNDDPLFTGEVLNATVAYNLAHPDPDKRTKITLTAVDRTKTLTAIGRPDGVSSITELAYVLEGCGLPWSLNTQTGHAPTTPPIVARNADAKALDQIAIVRDSVLGYAWVDRAGVVRAYDADLLDALVTIPYWAQDLDEDTYADVTVDYDLDRCINIVTLKYLRLDPVTGDTEEVTYGPYVDLESRNEWGPHEAEFTVQGLDEDPGVLQVYAEAILAANATPARRITGAIVHLRTTAQLYAWARTDLYDPRRCVATRAGLDVVQRVTGIKHRIVAGARDSLWTLELEFAADGSVAAPQAVPSPPATGAATLAQLLRPVGEVTQMMGLPSQVWPGWLVLDGAALTLGEYPELEEWLAAAGLSTTVLPDLTDRIPVAAGVKALGAKTGAWTKTITEAQLPPHAHTAGSLGAGSSGSTHTHDIPRGTAAGAAPSRVAAGNTTAAADGATGTAGSSHTHNVTGSTGNGAGTSSPLDITPRVFGLYFVIRAKSGV